MYNIKHAVIDVVVIGGGASGLTTALYTARASLKTVVIEKGLYGGQMQQTGEIENYSGFKHITGAELSDHMYNQAIEQGIEYWYGDVVSVSKKEDGIFEILLSDDEIVYSNSVVIATGVEHRKLGVDGEEALSGRGVSYCAICDGAFFKGGEVAVIGGGDSALEEASYLAQFVEKVTIIHRGDKFRGQKILQERVLNNPKIEVLYNSIVTSMNGEKKLEDLSVYKDDTGERIDLEVDGVFIYIGLDPITDIFKDNGILDDNGYIVTSQNMKTAVNGLFAVGDVRQKTVRQIATAVGDGAIAGVEVNKYLENLDK